MGFWRTAPSNPRRGRLPPPDNAVWPSFDKYEQWERLVGVAKQFLQTLPPQGDYVPVFFDLCEDLAMLLRRLDDLRPKLLTAWRKLLNIDVLIIRDSWKQQGLLPDPDDDLFLDFQAILEEGNKERLDRIRRESYQQALADTMATLESWMAGIFPDVSGGCGPGCRGRPV